MTRLVVSTMDEPPPSATATPPSASAFLRKHTHSGGISEDEAASSVSVGATDIVSNLIEGLVGGGATPTGAEDDHSSVVSGRSSSSMKHRRESARSYDQRLPKSYHADGEEEQSSAVPYRGFGGRRRAVASAANTDDADRPAPFANFRHRLRGLFGPRATDIQQLLIKLHIQFKSLDMDVEKYKLESDGSNWGEGFGSHAASSKSSSRKDPNHPLNNPHLVTEVHFVGRKATDASVVQLSSLLIEQDRFGCITELWLNDNLISDDGAAAIASFLEIPTCALIELWLGNNHIGPAGTTLISAALSNNGNSKLKCLGLYKNPIGNGGASTLAQMLRRNHVLSTMDIHGCGNRGKGGEVLEAYGCRVIKASDGTEYVAKVVAPSTEDEEGLVTDQRLLDAIQTFVAFNRIDPTREQAIRGIMTSNKMSQIDDGETEQVEDTNEQQHQTKVSKVLSELCNRPANEKLTEEEKRTWKDCEWERLYVELERARAAKTALASKLEIPLTEEADSKLEDEEFGEGVRIDSGETDGLVNGGGKEQPQIGQNLDDEVVRTDTRSWRDLKMGITGSAKPNPRERKAPRNNLSTHVEIATEAPPQTAFL